MGTLGPVFSVPNVQCPQFLQAVVKCVFYTYLFLQSTMNHVDRVSTYKFYRPRPMLEILMQIG